MASQKNQQSRHYVSDRFPLLTRHDVAEHLNCSLRTVDTLVACGELQALRIRRCVRFTQGAIDAYLRRVAGEKR
jgi:excisionase family DNA binding protein